MRSVGGLFDLICSPDNLTAAMARAARGKRHRGPVARFLADADAELTRLRFELADGNYRPRPLAQFAILDPKPRLISCADFRDRVVHHAVCAHVAPVIERRLISDNYACRTGKGSHRAVLRARDFSQRYRYCLRTDVRHYYETIDHGNLVARLNTLFREPRLRTLLETLVRAGLPGGVTGKGLPIGSLTSQWFANLYLDGIDHWIQEVRRPGAYLRYMDDMAAWADSKETLHLLALDLEVKLRDELGLELKREATGVAPCSEGLPFLGYRVYPGLVRERGARVRRRHHLLLQREAECRRGVIDETQLQASVRAMDGPRQFLGFGEPLTYLGRWSRGSNRVNRGGSWRNDDASNFRGANRNNNDPANRNDNQGFRLVSTTSEGKDTTCPPEPWRRRKPSNPSSPGSRASGNETTSPAPPVSPQGGPPLGRVDLFLFSFERLFRARGGLRHGTFRAEEVEFSAAEEFPLNGFSGLESDGGRQRKGH